MSQEPSTVRLIVVHAGHQKGPFPVQDVIDRLKAGTLAIDDLCWSEGTQDRAPLRTVLPKLMPQSRSPDVRPKIPKLPTARIKVTPPPVHTATNASSANTANRRPTAPNATEPPPLPPQVSSPPLTGKYGLWGWVAAAVLFVILLLVVNRNSIPVVSAPPARVEQVATPTSSTSTPPGVPRRTPVITPPDVLSFGPAASPNASIPSTLNGTAAAASPVLTPPPSPPSAASPILDNNLPGERFPETRLKSVTAAEIETWPLEKLQYAINEMYARYGAEFLDTSITEVFKKLPWYRPRQGWSYDDVEALFTPLEKENLKMLGFYRDSRVSSQQDTSDGNGPIRDEWVYKEPLGVSPTSVRGQSRLRFAPQPKYPYEARRAGLFGSGRFKIVFGRQGNAKSVQIIKSTGSAILDSTTIATLRRWRAQPGSTFTIQVPVTYPKP